MIEEILDRRSIRRFQSTPVPRQMLEELLQAGLLAPSSKNRQPWKFVVAEGDAKREALEAMERGLEREKAQPLLPESTQHLGGARYTLEIMKQAPAVIFVMNPLGLSLHGNLTPEQRIYELCNAQSIGAAMENMTLAATGLGLGSLWTCDTYFAYQELCQWLRADGELLAALAVGYGDERPAARPRKSMDEAVEWRGSID